MEIGIGKPVPIPNPILGKYKELQDAHNKQKHPKEHKPNWYCYTLPI